MATILGDVQYSQVMGHLPTPVEKPRNSTVEGCWKMVGSIEVAQKNGLGWKIIQKPGNWF